jgi:uncharacterized protein (DUF302 family)
MQYTVETAESFEQISTDLESAVKQQHFGLLHVHTVGTTLSSKGLSLD